MQAKPPVSITPTQRKLIGAGVGAFLLSGVFGAAAPLPLASIFDVILPPSIAPVAAVLSVAFLGLALLLSIGGQVTLKLTAVVLLVSCVVGHSGLLGSFPAERLWADLVLGFAMGLMALIPIEEEIQTMQTTEADIEHIAPKPVTVRRVGVKPTGQPRLRPAPVPHAAPRAPFPMYSEVRGNTVVKLQRALPDQDNLFREDFVG